MPLTTIETKETAEPLQRLQQDVKRFTPSTDFDYVDVTFGNANIDTIISTRLRPTNPESIVYTIVGLDFLSNPTTVPVIYKDTSSTRHPWGAGFIVLRSNVSGLIAHLKLEMKRTNTTNA